MTIVKSKVKCDQCGKTTEYDPNFMWTLSSPEVVTAGENTEDIHLCSWKCIAEYASSQEEQC